MKKTFTPKLQMNSKTKCKLNPKKSTIDYLLGFASSYEPSKVRNGQMPGFVLN